MKGVVGVPIEKVSSVEWMLIPLLILLISYALIRYKEENVLTNTLRRFFSLRYSNQSLREDHVQFGGVSGLLLFNSFFAVAIFIYKVLDKVLLSVNPYLLFTLILCGMLTWVVAKLGIISLIKHVTESGGILNQAKVYNFNYYQIIGILLVPGIIALLLFPEKIDLKINFLRPEYDNIGYLYSIFLVAILYIFKLFQNFKQSFGVKVSWYYIILYLCTLEILPLVVVYRLLIGKMGVFN